MIDDRVIKTTKVSYACYEWRADAVIVFYHYATPLAIYNEDKDRLWVTTRRWSQTSTRQRKSWVAKMRGPDTTVRRIDHWEMERRILKYRMECIDGIMERGDDYENHDPEYDVQIEMAAAKAATRHANKRAKHEDVSIRIPITRAMIDSGEVNACFVIED